jgi:surfactin synthase thioesterase subunit
MFYLPMSQSIYRNIDVVGVQYPGRQDRRTEPCIETIDELADGIAPAVRALADVPLVLFGHGMGATLAFAVTLRMERAGVGPLALIVSGRPAPLAVATGTRHHYDDEHLLPELAWLEPGSPLILADPHARQIVVTAMRADHHAAATYCWHPDDVVSCHVLAMVGDCDPTATIEEVRCWGEVTSGRFDLCVFLGGHFYLTSCPSTVANMISERSTVRGD